MTLTPLAQDWKNRYDKKWANAEQIKTLYDYKFITKEEYDYIINGDEQKSTETVN